MRRLLLLFTAYCLLTAAYSFSQCVDGHCPLTLPPSPRRPATPSSSFRYVAPAGHYRSVVRVEGHVGVGAKKLGSGVVVRWGDKTAILTAGHVARGCKEVRIYLPSAKRWVTARVLLIDDAWDVAVLVLPDADAAQLVAADIAWGGNATPAPGAKLESCGLGPDGRLAVNSGICLGYRASGAGPGRQADWLDLSGPARQGDSGGPVFDQQGQVVGILWGTDDRTVTATQAGYLHKLLADSLGPWDSSEGGNRKPETGAVAEAASVPLSTFGSPLSEETCAGNLLGRLKGKSKTPAPMPAPPQVIVNSDPEIRKDLRQIEGTLGQVAENTAPKPEPPDSKSAPPWAALLCILGGLALGAAAFLFVQRHP